MQLDAKEYGPSLSVNLAASLIPRVDMCQAKSCPLFKWLIFPYNELSLPLMPKALVNE
jgi:hypothetical protein